MAKGKLKYATIICIVVGFILLIVGYIKSDSLYYDNLLKSNNLSNPSQVFNWTTQNFSTPKSLYVHPNLSPRYLIEKHKSLWCDEGAIVMATLDNKLGYKTRLVDLYGYDNIAHHTILQVIEKGQWVNYDFTFRLSNQPLVKSSDSFHMKLKKGRIKTYPKLYNYLINNNYFIKRIVFALRGIKEEDPVR
ncbi:MAG: hypothetical protein JWQ34_3347 [Mucilaginibacter sp.]|uniref:hypothetical protein n=1 Tax=Mucilaginibacter sp. TaxID=1882438 RepID=UPI0026291561|nr:hypothetical protein [Mucilaginibacter sp.]MDB5005122.1 hypothetical protein [Mucilaginibacter sp.]